jgi:hypothetical protein
MLLGKSANLEIVPHVFLIAEAIPEFLVPYSEFISLRYVADVDSAFAAQNIRTFAAGTFNTDYVMTSDIDMLPLDLKVTARAQNRLISNSEAFVVVRDVLEPGQFAICYGMARPETWRKVMWGNSEKDPWEEIRNLFRSRFSEQSYSGNRGGSGWFTDQEVLFERVTGEPSVVVIRMKDSETGHRRLDRAHHPKWLIWFLLPLIINGRYSDYHVHLPVSNTLKQTSFIRIVVSLRERLLCLKT